MTAHSLIPFLLHGTPFGTRAALCHRRGNDLQNLTTALDRLVPLRSALESSPSALLVMDAAGNIVFANAEIERMFGYATDELVGQSVDVLVPDGLPRLPVADRQTPAPAFEARASGSERELMGRRKDGCLIPIEVRTNLQSDDFTVASVVDISDRLSIEASRRAALEEQLASERLIAQFSLQCINLSEGQLSEAIREVLGRLGERLDVDRGTFFRFGPDDALLDLVQWMPPTFSESAWPAPDRSAFPWLLKELQAGTTVSFSSRDEIPDEQDRTAFAGNDTRSAVYVPVSVGDRVAGALGMATVGRPRLWPPDVLRRLQVVAIAFGQAIAGFERHETLRIAHAEVQRLKDRLQAENVYLRREERERLGMTRIVGHSPPVLRVMQQIRQVAPTDSTVLLLGETGTGKELFATHIHELSSRHTRAMVRVNCGAIPTTLIESELFGREKGAFTGALARQAGRFELADHSTIFLDEIGDLPQEVQVKLLRVLEERTIERLGSPRPITVDTRIIAATHRNLEQRVHEGTFREDLYYRLNVFPIVVPPLRERAEDIPLLVWRAVEEFSKAFGKRVDSIDKESLVALQQYHWPGNIRELRNMVERAMIVATGRRLTITLQQPMAVSSRRSTRLVDVERDHIRTVLESARWRIRGPGGAADRLGLKPTTLETRMAKLGIRRPKTT